MSPVIPPAAGAARRASSIPPAAVVVMGVSGCGKSSLAVAVARALGWQVIEGDDFHSARNKSLMQAGVPLTDADRAGWLAALGGELARRPEGVLLSCSALKLRYRDQLRAARPGLLFAFLDITPELALQRVRARAGEHFFHPALVKSQFDALEPPTGEPGVLRLDAADDPARLASTVIDWLAAEPSHATPSQERTQ